MGAAYDPATANRLNVTYQPDGRGGCAVRLEYTLEQYGWSAFWIKLDGADLSPYHTLNFWARSEEGVPAPAFLKIELKRANNQETAFIIYPLTLTPAGNWFSVRLDKFPIAHTQMSELVFTFEHNRTGPTGVIILDDIYVRE